MKSNNEYFDWLVSIINREGENNSYLKLLYHLYSVDFYSVIQMDTNREKDGLDLRNRFKREYDLSYSDNLNGVLDRNCSVLEVMIALATRCEDYMWDPDLGDRTSYWFWGMVNSLGLADQDDYCYDEFYVDQAISIFLDREYDYDGQGGLFTVIDPPYDMRNTEIWYQMNLYLKQNF